MDSILTDLRAANFSYGESSPILKSCVEYSCCVSSQLKGAKA
jgi:hypothetical protein